MIRIIYHARNHWPKLAWLATLTSGSDLLEVEHGPNVEISDQWFSEAAWVGPFVEGNFDQTESIFGSGGRVREDGVAFVGSATTLDRLNWIEKEGKTFVSNSLVCLMQRIGASLDPTASDYQGRLSSVILGIEKYGRNFPTDVGAIQLAYHNNLFWNGKRLEERKKPQTAPNFKKFTEYRDYLQSTMNGLAANGADPARRHPFALLGTMSSGYDSACISAIGKGAGLKQVLSITRSKSGKTDSGEQVAQQLGLELLPIDRDAYRQVDLAESYFVSSDAKGEDVYFSAAAKYLSGRILLTGYCGDLNWDIENSHRGNNYVRGDRSGLSMSEYRLHAGYIHCPFAYVGARNQDQIVAISHSEEMKPWDTGGDYTRPIPRRILEEAGVRRGTFATEKRAASVMLSEKRDQLSPSTTRDFHEWLRTHSGKFWRKGSIPPLTKEKWLAPFRSIARRGWGIHARAMSWPKPLRFVSTVSWRAAEWSEKERLSWFLFPWAVERTKGAYRNNE